MPVSEKQHAANIANSKKSTGPRTPRGKSNTSRNAVKHGLLARAILIDGESRDAFDALLTSLHKEFQPDSTTEMTMVDTLAATQWRRLRLWTMESAGMTHQMRGQSGEDSPTRALLAATSSAMPIELVQRYEYRLDRQYHRALKVLRQIREEKHARTKASQIPLENKGQSVDR